MTAGALSRATWVSPAHMEFKRGIDSLFTEQSQGLTIVSMDLRFARNHSAEIVDCA